MDYSPVAAALIAIYGGWFLSFSAAFCSVIKRLWKSLFLPVFAPKFNITSKQTSRPQRCVYCHVEDWEFTCSCGAAYHKECFYELSKCATLGCERTSASVKKCISEVAYYIWVQEGRQPDTSISNWARAEATFFEHGIKAMGILDNLDLTLTQLTELSTRLDRDSWLTNWS